MLCVGPGTFVLALAAVLQKARTCQQTPDDSARYVRCCCRDAQAIIWGKNTHDRDYIGEAPLRLASTTRDVCPNRADKGWPSERIGRIQNYEPLTSSKCSVSPNRKYCSGRDQTRQLLGRQHLSYSKASTFHPVCSGVETSLASVVFTYLGRCAVNAGSLKMIAPELT